MNRPPPRRGAPAEAAAFVDTIGDHEAFTPALRGGAYYDGQVPGHGDSWRRAVRPGPRFFNRTSNKKFTPIGAISACWYSLRRSKPPEELRAARELTKAELAQALNVSWERFRGRLAVPQCSSPSTTRCAAKISFSPTSARSMRPLSWLREKLPFSAVAWVSINPPSAVITTFMSTSAAESSS